MISLNVHVTDEVIIAVMIPIQTDLRYMLKSAAGVSEAKKRCDTKNPSKSSSLLPTGIIVPNTNRFANTISPAAIITAQIVNFRWLDSSSANMFLYLCSNLR
jgi:hypothetical protein